MLKCSSKIFFIGLLVFPASTNYELHTYDFGSGGNRDQTSTNFRLNAISGQSGSGLLSGTNYQAGAGLIFIQQADVPPAPTLVNANNYYNKLTITLDAGGNPSDTKYAIAISADGFAADTRYVQNDNTIGTTLGVEDYQTYAAWGGASGEDIIGLLPSTTYTVKVKAIHGDFTETGWGPTANAATVGSQLSFDIDVSVSDTETGPPFTMNLGSLPAGSVVGSSEKIWVDIDTNATAGARVYVASGNAGLASVAAAYTITAVSGDLTALNEGFGAQGLSATQTTGGPLTISSPYNVSGNTVGITDTLIRNIFESGTPLTGGRGSFGLKAKSSTLTPAATDYTETLTIVAAAQF